MENRPPGRPGHGDELRAWIEANRGRLPQTYDEFSSFPLAHRRAIFAELSPQARSRLWTEQLTRYRDTHPDLTPQQNAVLEHALELFSDPETFAVTRTEPDPTLDRLQEEAIAAYGHFEARALLATLGPPDDGGKPPTS